MKIDTIKSLAQIISLSSGLLATSQVGAANGYFDCPLTPTEFQVPIPNPDPPTTAGEFPTNLDEIFDYVLQNNIGFVKELLDHLPDHMRKNYAFVAKTRGLNKTSLEEPGLMLFGSDGRFMMNIGTIPSAPLFEVVDIAYLNDRGDWEFKSLDFRVSPPVLSPNGGNNNECRECHGKGGINSTGPMRPVWGNYLDWPGIFSDDGKHLEKITSAQVAALTRIKNGIQNQQRFHTIIPTFEFFDKVEQPIFLPDRQYGNSLTVANNEIGSAVAESIFKRAKRSPLYNQLREEYLALAYCGRVGKVSPEDKKKLINLIQEQGGTTEDITYRIDLGWMDIIRLWGLDPQHEFALHKLTNEYSTTIRHDTNWDASSGSLDEQVTLLVLLDLTKQNSQVDALLRNNLPSYEMTNCGTPFNMKGYLQHKVYANFTLKGNARQLARSSYYDINYTRFTETMENVKTELCALLTSEIGIDTPQPTVPDPVVELPTALSPQGIINMATPAFSWKEVPGTLHYAIVIYDNKGAIIANTRFDSNAVCAGGVCSVTRNIDVLMDGTYRWNVHVVNPDNSNGINSNTLGFTVETQTELPHQIIDACQQGQAPVGNVEILNSGNAMCLQDVSNGGQLQMHLYVPDNQVGSSLEIILKHGSGNSTLLYMYGNRPTNTVFDSKSNNPGNDEKLLIRNIKGGWNYIHVQAETFFSGVTLFTRFIH